VIQQNDPDHYALVENVPTIVGARTGGLLGGNLYVGVPSGTTGGDGPGPIVGLSGAGVGRRYVGESLASGAQVDGADDGAGLRRSRGLSAQGDTSGPLAATRPGCDEAESEVALGPDHRRRLPPCLRQFYGSEPNRDRPWRCAKLTLAKNRTAC
jgi:hypothetical protein